MKSQLSESSCFDDNRSVHIPTQAVASNFPYVADGISPRPIMKHVSAIGIEPINSGRKTAEQRPGNYPRRLISHNYVKHSQSIQEPSPQITTANQENTSEEPKRSISIDKVNKQNIEGEGDNENTGNLTPVNPSPYVQSIPSSKIYAKAVTRVYLFYLLYNTK